MAKTVVICIGATSVVGDSLGPRVGDILTREYELDAYVYGNSLRQVHGGNYASYVTHLKKHHKGSFIVAVDACVGRAGDVGKVKFTSAGVSAGGALNKQLGRVGDVGLLGIVAEIGEDNLHGLLGVKSEFIDEFAVKIASYVEFLVKCHDTLCSVK